MHIPKSLVGLPLLQKWESLKKSQLKDYFSTFIATGLIQLIGIITGVITARLLGPAGKGDLSTIIWLPTLMTAIGIIGIPQAVTLITSRNIQEDKVLNLTSFWLIIGIGIFEVAMLYPLIPPILGSAKSHLVSECRLFLLYIPLSLPALVLFGIDQGQQKFNRYNMLRPMPVVLYMIGLLILWGAELGNLYNVLIVFLIGQAATTIIRASVSGRYLFSIPKIEKRYIDCSKRLLRQGLVFYLPAISGILLMRIDIALLSWKASSEEVGYYAVALAIAMGQTGLSSSLVQVNFPKIAGAPIHDAREILRQQFKNSILPVLGMGLVVAFFSKWIIQHIFGNAFLPAYTTGLILIPAMAIWGLNQIIENGLRGIGLGWPGSLSNAVGLVIQVGFAILLIRYLKSVGMAIAMLFSQVSVMAILYIIFNKTLNRTFLQDDSPKYTILAH
jgi:O-antigen/teichoic acid export membrane protein